MCGGGGGGGGGGGVGDGRDAFKPKHASSVSISEVIDTGMNSNEQ